jgi:hypothetical protein
MKTQKSEAVARLRAQRLTLLEESSARGRELGRQYVDEFAHYVTVQQLLRAHADACRASTSHPTPWSSLIDILKNTDEEEFYIEQVKEHELRAEQFAMGFLQGAAKRWREIEAEVEA